MNTDKAAPARRPLKLRVALSLTTALACGIAAPALAQNAPYKNLDANGVDLTDGSFNFDLIDGSIGSSEAAMSLTTYADGSSNWPTYSLVQQKSGSTYTIIVRVGNTYDTFSSTFTSIKSTRATNSSINFTVGGDYLYTGSDGSQITFRNPLTSIAGGTSNLCDVNNQNNCTLLAASMTAPDGLAFTYNWTVFGNCSGINCNYSWRLGSVSNSGGYLIGLSFVSNSTTPGSDPSADWFKRSSAVFSNTNTGSAPWPTATYTYPTSTTRTITTPGGKTWGFTSDSSNRLVGVRRPSASSDTTTIIYGTNGVSSITRDGITTTYNRTLADFDTKSTMVVTDALSNSSTVVSNMPTYRPTSVTDANGKVTGYAYDSFGNLTGVTYPEGNQVQYTLDSRGNAITTTYKAKPGSGLSDIVTTATYGPSCLNKKVCNQPHTIVDANGNQADYTFDTGSGHIASVTLPAATTGGIRPQIRYTYTLVNGVSMLTGASQCQTGSSCAGTADEVKTDISYNSNLLATSVGSGAGDASLTATTMIGYDAIGNVTTKDGPLPGTADTTTYRWSADRELVGMISADPDGAGTLKRRAVKQAYNADGQPTVTEAGTVNGTADPDWSAFASAQQVTSTYDANGFKTREVSTASSTTYQVTDYSYDADGRPECAALRMNSAVWGSAYAACSLNTIGSYGADRITKTTYDPVGRPTKTYTGYGISGVQVDDATVTYTDNGRVAAATDAEGNKTSYTYDGFDRLTKTQYPSTIKGAGTSSSTDYTELVLNAGSQVTSRRLRGFSGDSSQHIDYTYDNLGRLTVKTLPNSELPVSYTYDLLGRMTGAGQSGTGATSLTFTYDALGRNLTQGGPLGTISYQYDAAGQRTRMDWPDSSPNQFYVTYDHLVTGEVSVIREKGAPSGLGVLAAYAYDDLGRRTSLTYGNGTVSTYSYDNVSRLSSLALNLDGGTTTNDTTTTFGYSPANSIATQTRTNDLYAWGAHYNVGRSYTSNGLNQYTAVGATSPTYDARGNVTASDGNSFSYSSENLLTSATVGGVPSTHDYDPMLRIYKSTTTVGQRYQYDGTDLIGLYSDAGALTKRFVFGPGMDEPIVVYAGSGTGSGVRTFFHADERGSIIAQSDENGAKTGIFSYDEYGISSIGNSSRFEFTSQAWLPQLGMYYYKARMYSPTLGRFMQTDPIGYGDGMNVYAYVRNDPVNGRDPIGTTGVNGAGDGCCVVSHSIDSLNTTELLRSLMIMSALKDPRAAPVFNDTAEIKVVAQRKSRRVATFLNRSAFSCAFYGGPNVTVKARSVGIGATQITITARFAPASGPNIDQFSQKTWVNSDIVSDGQITEATVHSGSNSEVLWWVIDARLSDWHSNGHDFKYGDLILMTDGGSGKCDG